MHKKELEKAYGIVFHDILREGPRMFSGIYDAKNGKRDFMYGIKTVMEYLAFKADDTEKTYEQFSDFFVYNIVESEYNFNGEKKYED